MFSIRIGLLWEVAWIKSHCVINFANSFLVYSKIALMSHYLCWLLCRRVDRSLAILGARQEVASLLSDVMPRYSRWPAISLTSCPGILGGQLSLWRHVQVFQKASLLSDVIPRYSRWPAFFLTMASLFSDVVLFWLPHKSLKTSVVYSCSTQPPVPVLRGAAWCRQYSAAA